jgi:hypothetical protein
MRLYEAIGKGTEATISIPFFNLNSISIYECDLMERKISSELITSLEPLAFTTQFTAYEIKTFLISDSLISGSASQSPNSLQILHQKLVSLQQAIANQPDHDPSIVKVWARSLEEILHFFQSAIVDANQQNQAQNQSPIPSISLQVEIDKQLKMLGVDLSMLQSARKLDTWQKRHRQTDDRLTLLLRYSVDS